MGTENQGFSTRQVGLLTTDERREQLTELLTSAGIEATVLLDKALAFAFEGCLCVDSALYPNPKSFAQMLARYSSAHRGRIAIGIVSDLAEHHRVLREIVLVKASVAVDLCLEAAIPQELALHLERSQMLAQRAFETDPLTGLGDRRGMREYVSRTLARIPENRSAALFLLDLDHFKAVNDTYGHSSGDEMLRQCGHIVRNFGAAGVRAFRIGGDEIGGVIIESSRAAVVETLESLCRAIAAAQFRTAGHELRITASIGFTFLVEGLDIEEAYRQGDTAIYAAKTAGRNRAQPFDLCWDQADEDADAAAFSHLENVTRLWTERLSETILSVARKAFEASRETAERDGLTELYNRRYFDRRLSRELQNAVRADGEPSELSLILLDVDNFHDVNMAYGYPTGDYALKEVARAVENHSRLTDWVARYGGEEFVIVMPGTDREEAALVAERIRAAIEAMTVEGYGERTLSITVSMGVSELSELENTDRDVDAIVQQASDRVIAAKHGGKNRVVSRTVPD